MYSELVTSGEVQRSTSLACWRISTRKAHHLAIWNSISSTAAHKGVVFTASFPVRSYRVISRRHGRCLITVTLICPIRLRGTMRRLVAFSIHGFSYCQTCCPNFLTLKPFANICDLFFAVRGT